MSFTVRYAVLMNLNSDYSKGKPQISAHLKNPAFLFRKCLLPPPYSHRGLREDEPILAILQMLLSMLSVPKIGYFLNETDTPSSFASETSNRKSPVVLLGSKMQAQPLPTSTVRLTKWSHRHTSRCIKLTRKTF